MRQPESILTVTVNPAIDKTYLTDQFSVGGIARASEVVSVCGGKGLNVLRVLDTLGFDAVGTGMLGGWEGEWLSQTLTQEGLAHSFYRIAGSSRMTHAILDQRTGTMTELREPGPIVQAEEAEGFLQHMNRLLRDVGHVTLSGSLSPGLDPDYYAKLAKCAEVNHCKVYVDTGGRALREVLRAGVYLVKINEQEFREWLSSESSDCHVVPVDEGEPLDEQAMIDGLQQLRHNGCEVAIVTLGAKGSYACDDSGAWRVYAPGISPVNTVGSGDAFLAGMVGALSHGTRLREACTLAAAAAASNALHRVAGQVDLHDIDTLSPQVRVVQVV